jgi:hypothetical protein
MSFAYVQSTSTNGNASSAALTLTATAGNLIWLVAAQLNANGDSGVPSWSDNNSNTITAQFSRNDVTDLFASIATVKNANAGSTTFTATWTSAGDYALAALEYSGGDPAGSWLGAQFDSASSSSAADSGPLFLFQKAMVLVLNAGDSTATYTTTGSGFTERVNISSGNVPLVVADLFSVTNGSRQCTWTLNSVIDWQGLIGGWPQFVPLPTSKGMYCMDVCI